MTPRPKSPRASGRPRKTVPARLARELQAAAAAVVECEVELDRRRLRLARTAARAAAAGGSVRVIAELLETSPARVVRLLGGA